MDFCRQHLSGIRKLLERYGLSVVVGDAGTSIPGSYWGAPEAGLIGTTVHVLEETPLHSALHESAHFVCMTTERRQRLHTNAGGDYLEESAVCYLSVLMADQLSGFGRQKMFRDMDDWGYTFRLGASQRWFETDAEDAREWLERNSIVDRHAALTWSLRA